MTPDAHLRQALVIDDSPAIRRELADVLSGLGFTVLEAADGAQGLSQWRVHRPTVILLDLELPVLDGPSLLRLMRANGAHEPVILVTAVSNMRKVRDAIKVGASDYLAKPFTEVSVREVLERIGIAPGPA